MFGFMLGPCGCRSKGDRSLYRGIFCGLGSRLSLDYGPAARFLVNRDAAFLSLLGHAVETGPETDPIVRTCCNPLARPRPMYLESEAAGYAAAVTICGAARKLEDNVEDERGWKKQAALWGEMGIRQWTERAQGRLRNWGLKVDDIREILSEQNEAEEASRRNHLISTASAPTKMAYGEIFAGLLGSRGREVGEGLGSLLYLRDAAVDLPADRREQRFNPLLEIDSKERSAAVESDFDQGREALQSGIGGLPWARWELLSTETTARTLSIRRDEVLSSLGGETRATGGAVKDKKRKKKKKDEECWCDCCPAGCCCDSECGSCGEEGSSPGGGGGGDGCGCCEGTDCCSGCDGCDCCSGCDCGC